MDKKRVLNIDEVEDVKHIIRNIDEVFIHLNRDKFDTQFRDPNRGPLSP
jgi:hypothetical protein